MNRISGVRGQLFLKPGELAVTEVPTKVSTVLGSCIALTFYNRRLCYGAICHAMLPDGPGKERFKYVVDAFDYMLGRFSLAGIGRNEIEVKLFGGAEVLPQAGGGLAVGRQNVEAAKALILKEGLQLCAESSGGSSGLKLHFFTHTGDIFIKRLFNEVATDV